MISLNLDKIIDGAQLIKELVEAGIAVEKNSAGNYIDPLLDADSQLWLAIEAKDKTKAKAILDNHIPKPAPEPTVEEKLASVGLSVEDLKAALGL
jgi:hypothetical protein